ncbi:glycoside hydrolase family 31 protein [Ophiocordyceps camponoti-floridani]|uniref:Glycoside hydrolase family 31 protein n=1 Tax=Ophiocordyceps camponoti-floridani TaxID=2030778 RepID=A0A8H4QAJ4_9HYPO|nr:glycoside hydrolase family 31 protein [Ophiocordyceps camponoti-floridani]
MRFWGTFFFFATAAANGLDACRGYEASHVSHTDSGLTASLRLLGQPCNAYGTDLDDLTLEVTHETDERLHVKIQDRANQVYQVPESVFPRPRGRSSRHQSKLKFNYTASPFSFQVLRAGSNEVLFDTSAASLVFQSQYLRLRTALPKDPYLYGLGEHSDPFRLKTNNYTRTLWNADSYGVSGDTNQYGSHPFYLEQRQMGSHGVFLLNSNGMDIFINSTDDGKQYLEYNTLGGVFDFWFFSGPGPIAVAQQYGEVAGFPALQPYWGLGFHQCRYGYQDAYDVAEVVHNYSLANIPLETMWTDIDYMDRRRTFSLDLKRFPLGMMRQLVSHLHNHDQHYVVMVDPAVAYQDYPPLRKGVDDDVFLRRDNGSLWLGVVWPGVSVFPDWFASKTQEYWNGQIASFFSPTEGIDIDALWIDMNEPSNSMCPWPCDKPYEAARGMPPPAPPVRQPPRPLPGWPCEFQPPGTCRSERAMTTADTVPLTVLTPDTEGAPVRRSGGRIGDAKGLPGRNLLYPKYAIHNKMASQDSWNSDRGGLSNRTVHTDVHHQNGLVMYDTHNLFGSMMSTASREAMLARRPSKRPLIITRSTYAGAGSKVGHWLGDNLSTWDMYRNSIRSMLVFTALFQFSMVGSDVCGFGQDTTEELCARWASLGAFSTFYRNHNEEGALAQEFYRWESVAESARKAIAIRYRLLDYMYTAMRASSSDGRPALQPVFFLYPHDRRTWPLELQYFYGPALLVAPVTQKGATDVRVYLPDDIFYDWYTHKPIRGNATQHTFTNQDLTTIPLLIRGGTIIPARLHPAMTTTQLRHQDFELLIALDAQGEATGELYLDDGEALDPSRHHSLISFRYRHRDGLLSMDGSFDYPARPPRVVKVTVMDAAAESQAGGVRQHAAGESRSYSQSHEVQLSLDRSRVVRLP